MKKGPIAVIGAGASGLLCAYFLGRNGYPVEIFEKNDRMAKKLNATGNGRCNFTNAAVSPDQYYGSKDFIKEVLNAVPVERVLACFREIGVFPYEKDGYFYPYSNRARTVSDALVQGVKQENITVHLSSKVVKIRKTSEGFAVYVKGTEPALFQKVILACGGAACSSLGGSGSGYLLAKSLSHSVQSPVPGLTGISLVEDLGRVFQKIRCRGQINVVSEGVTYSDTGEIQWVKEGISGIPVFQVSRVVARALEEGKEVKASVDFLPDMTVEEAEEWVSVHGYDGLFHERMSAYFKKHLIAAATMKDFPITPVQTFGMERAQVTAGGVVTEEVDEKTMESKHCKNLYILGELLDVDGICGGFNLHFAWATALICKDAICRDVIGTDGNR